MSMRQDFLWFVFYFWFFVVPCQLAAYYVPWVGGTRVPGRLLGRVWLLKQLGRRKAETRLDAVKSALTERLGPREEWEVLTSEPLVDHVQAHATWLRLSRTFLAAPGMLACAALALVIASSAWPTWPLWAIGVYLSFVQVSALLTCIDIWAVRNADSAGTATAVAVGVLESFTTRADKAPAKSTRVTWQSQMIEQLCESLVRRAYRESSGAVPGSRLAMAHSTASVVRAMRHRAALVHGDVTSDERAIHERELMLLVCSILKYSSRRRADVVDFRLVDEERLADVPEEVPDTTAVPSSKARVLVPLLFLGALVAIAIGLGATGATGEFTTPVVMALAMVFAPLTHQVGVTVLDSFAEPLTSLTTHPGGVAEQREYDGPHSRHRHPIDQDESTRHAAGRAGTHRHQYAPAASSGRRRVHR
ncbi:MULTISPECIES: hypothetical protein [Streptomyces]|uniref:hypothetical protein n=1 Tax=Streptomyces TaxID=1883 RepID=UPI000F74125C|nr:hypothetical protein [Streptomyces sp. WAC06273]RSS71231.1 hypothetical protein EF907_02590 [Streptomyces sp. WAC06273]